MSQQPLHHVILVRDWDVQVSGSGCCGRLSGAGGYFNDTESFADVRRGMEAMGHVYRALARTYGDRLGITVIDPRNFATLFVLVVRDRWLSGGWRHVLRVRLGGISHIGLICDGDVLISGRIPEPDEAVALVAPYMDTISAGPKPV